MQRRLTSSGSFTIATVEDGVSQPSYIRTQEAWSNDATTANAATSPTISGNWSDSTPVKTATYLWRRSCLMTLNEATRTYNSGTWSYQRLSGENGTSIHTVGQVTNASSRGSGTATIITDGGTQTISLVDGDAVTQLDDGHLYQWVTEGGGKWLDLGVFKGESGVTYFTHIAWATETADPTQEHPAPSPAQGQTTRPNKYSVTGGSIAPFDGAVWMGILVNTSLSDSTDFNLYTWNEVKGSPSIFVTLSNDNDTMLYSSGSNIPISGNVVSTATLYDGAEPKTSAADGVTWSIAPSVGVTAVIANNVVTISAMATTSGTVTVKATYKGNIYSKQITLKKLVDKDKYDVIVTPNSVAYNSTTDTPETTSITLKCYKTIVTGERADATPPSGYYLALFGKKANGTVIRIGYTNAFKTLTTTCDNSLYEECIAAICNNTVFDNITEFLDYQTIPITKAENGNKGEDAFRCSIDNQHEDFLYNDDGTLISPSGGATSQAMLYQGEQNMTPMANWLISSDGGSTWASSVTGTVTASIVTSGTNIGKLTVLGFSGASAKVLVRAEYPSTNGTFYYAEFTANKTSQDKYDLIISPNSIAYNPATYVTQQVSVSAKRTDFQGNTTSVPISLQENVGKLRLFTAVVLQDGKHTQLSQIDELPLFVNEIIADNFVGMYIELRKYVNPNGSNASSNVVVDYQTIPITKAENGNKGEDAVVYKISLAGSVFSVDPNQSGGLLHFNINGTVYKTVGGTTSIYTELTEHLLTLSTISSDGQETTLSTGDYSVSNGEFTSTVYEGTGYDDESIFLAVLTIGNREVARESIQIERYGENGQTGQRGKVGRFFYFGGTFDSNNNSLRYTVNDAQAPYFEHTENGQKRYHVFNYETNGSYTMSQMWAISSNWNNKPWESMTNDFKYIITEATFSQFAHLGSFIISKDYFISQYGTLFYNNNGAIETTVINASNVSTLFGGSVAYAWFADSDPMVGTMPTTGNYKFRPMKCINALTGEEWMAQGKVHVDADGNVTMQNVEVKNGVYVDRVDKEYRRTWRPAAWSGGATASPKVYEFFEVERGSKIVQLDPETGENLYTLPKRDSEGHTWEEEYYYMGKITLKCNHLFVYADGILNAPSIATGEQDKATLRIILPPPQYFIGQTLVITNKSTGFPTGTLILEQAYIKDIQPISHGYGYDHICLTIKELIHISPDYPYGQDYRKECAPFLTDGSWVNELGQVEASIDDITLINGIWQLNETGTRPYPKMLSSIDLDEYEWLELTAVSGEYSEWTDLDPEIVAQNLGILDVSWMITRWEKKQTT